MDDLAWMWFAGFIAGHGSGYHSGAKTQTQLAKMFGVTHSTIQYRLWGGWGKNRKAAS